MIIKPFEFFFAIGEKVVRFVTDREPYYYVHFLNCVSPHEGYVINTEVACPYGDEPNYDIYRFECSCDGKHSVWVKRNELASFDLYYDFQDRIDDRLK